MRRLSHLWFPLTRSVRRVTVAAVGGGHSLREEDMEDEERLARLLVQDAATFVAISASPSSLSDGAATVAVEDGQEDGVTESTLVYALAQSGEAIPPIGLSLTPSRQSNDHLSKYVQVRIALHTQHLSDGTLAERAREWMCCGCRTYNFIGRKTCRRCKQRDVESFKHHFPPARHIPLFPTSWLCHSCGHSNRSDAQNSHTRDKFYCSDCGEPFHGLREWYCNSCNHINSRASIQCATCFEARSSTWTCTSCKHEKNSIFFTQCRYCHVSRRKLVSDSTILCPICQQRNDVQWEMCFACMTPLGIMPTVNKLSKRFGKDNTKETSNETTPTPKAAANPTRTEELTRKEECENVKEANIGEAKLEMEEEHQKLLKDNDESDSHATMVVGGPPTTAVEAKKEPSKSVPSLRNETPQEDTSAPPPPVLDLALEDGAWWCTSCHVLQRRNALFCDICLRPKSMAASTSLAAAASLLPRPFSGDWRCPFCRQLSPATVSVCCGAPRAVPAGYWQCAACCSVNRDARRRCIGCASPPPASRWRCACCGGRNSADSADCACCGAAHPQRPAAPSPPPPRCHMCGAPNRAERRSCHRCRARLSDDAWCCTQCGAEGNVRSARRCAACEAPRPFNPREESWVCDVCGTAVASGGDIPIRAQCPKCDAARTARSLTMPSRWKCQSCGVPNAYAAARCQECDAKRRLDGLRSTCSCPNCFRLTALDAAERCEHCGGDLARVVSTAGSDISLSEWVTDQTEGEERDHNPYGRTETSVLHATIHRREENDADVFHGPQEGETVEEDEDGNERGGDGLEELHMESEEDWGGDVPSWLCANCETANLEEAEKCVSCGIRRGDD